MGALRLPMKLMLALPLRGGWHEVTGEVDMIKSFANPESIFLVKFLNVRAPAAPAHSARFFLKTREFY